MNNNSVEIPVMRESIAADLPLPALTTEGAAAVDLRAALEHPVTLRPLERKLINTGLRLAIPKGYEGQVRPRSGLAIKSGIAVLNSPGTIDSDYRGLVQIILINLSNEEFIIKHGDRIAQLVIAPVTHAVFVETEELSQTTRGENGFGSTGIQ